MFNLTIVEDKNPFLAEMNSPALEPSHSKSKSPSSTFNAVGSFEN